MLKKLAMFAGKKFFGKQKTTGTEVIRSIKPNVGKSKSTKMKNRMKRSFQKMEEDIDPARIKLRQTTQKLAGEKVTKSGISKGKDLKK